MNCWALSGPKLAEIISQFGNNQMMVYSLIDLNQNNGMVLLEPCSSATALAVVLLFYHFVFFITTTISPLSSLTNDRIRMMTTNVPLSQEHLPDEGPCSASRDPFTSLVCISLLRHNSLIITEGWV